MKTDKKTLVTKGFNLRMPKETWRFVKRISFTQEISMTDFLLRCIEKYKKKHEDRLTRNGTNV